jgi:hypothetical protein
LNRVFWKPISLGVLVLALIVAACGGDSPSQPGNGDPATIRPTPTLVAGTLPDDLSAVLERVAELRGLAAPPNLQALVVERDDLEALLDSLYTPEDLKWFNDTTTLYRLLGHFRQDQDFLTIFQSFGTQAVLGLYAPDRDTLWVVVEDEADGFGDLSRIEEQTLAHELVHAIQDYRFDLDDVYLTIVEDLDRNLAWSAVIEGDAVAIEERYSEEFMMIERAGVAFLLAAPDLAQVTDIPQSIVRELYFPYTTGVSAVAGIVDGGDRDLIDQLLAVPPSGTAVIMHPELLAAGWQPKVMTLPDFAGGLGDGWTRESGGALGEFNLQNYLTLTIRSDAAEEAAEGWAGDRYDVYVSGDDSVAVFRVAFADDDEADELRAAINDILRVVRADISDRGSYRLASFPSGRGYAIFDSLPSEVLFAIASSPEIAAQIAELVAEE